MLFFITHHHIDFSVLEHHRAAKPSILFDDEGNEWGRFQLDRRENSSLHELPPHVLNAFIAAEDHDFWQHSGLSFKGILRSILTNLYHRKMVQGASTITQQLVRLLFLDSRKTLIRKIKEQCVALLVELQFSKEHILQTYLNNVYFGCGIYGVEAACQRFWQKSASSISIAQGATLAAIMKSPGQYCPLLSPLSSIKRRNLILKSMFQLGMLESQEYEEALNEPLDLVSLEGKESLAPHVKESLRVFLEKLVGKDRLYRGGLKIQTTVNTDIQKRAQEAFYTYSSTVKKKISPDVDGALICMHVESGEIKALVGGIDYTKSKFNRALQAKRQFGSIFKPLVYAAAIKEGFTFNQTFVDEPFTIEQNGKTWSPHNSSNRFEGQMTLARALSRSNNIITIKTLLAVGIEKVIQLARQLHLKEKIVPYPSLALGCVDGTLKEAVGMFNVYANNGMYIEPHIIKWVKNEWGAKIWRKKIMSNRVLSSPVNSQVAKVLSLGMERMKRRNKPDWISCDAIGKTGTTNDCRTCWFCGSTPSYTTALYLGCDDNRSLGKDIYAASTAFPIWLALNKAIKQKKKSFYYDSSLQEIFIDDKSGRISQVKNVSSLSILIPKSG